MAEGKRRRKLKAALPFSIPKLPKTGTRALEDFLVTYVRTQDFVRFLLAMVVHVEDADRRFHEMRVELAPSGAEKAELIEKWATYQGPTHDLKHHRQFLMEVILARHVDNFLAFLSALLAEVFVARPETLKSGEKVEIEWVLGHGSMSSLVDGLAERKVDALAYKSFDDLREFVRERFDLSICADADNPDFIRAIEARNLSVHNRAIINRRFVERTGEASDKLGKRLPVGLVMVEKTSRLLLESALRLDLEARKQLRLKPHRFDAMRVALARTPAPSEPVPSVTPPGPEPTPTA
jgi:hypothetical protein